MQCAAIVDSRPSGRGKQEQASQGQAEERDATDQKRQIAFTEKPSDDEGRGAVDRGDAFDLSRDLRDLGLNYVWRGSAMLREESHAIVEGKPQL
jgi:hypothetical protein